jgi:molybdate transport system substrate-binding protein
MLTLAMAANSANAAELIVSAAASLTNAFTELGKAFERENASHAVVMNFGGSGQLLQQIDRGAPVDVFATADQETMDRAESKRLLMANSRVDFARNSLLLIAPADSNLIIATLDDLRGDAIERIAVSNPASVPVGRYLLCRQPGCGRSWHRSSSTHSTCAKASTMWHAVRSTSALSTHPMRERWRSESRC